MFCIEAYILFKWQQPSVKMCDLGIPDFRNEEMKQFSRSFKSSQGVGVGGRLVWK
jgi:hypothetical protein